MRRANAASIAMLLLLPLFISQNHAQASSSSSLTLILTTNKATYYPPENVEATTRFLNGTEPIPGASVTLEVTLPDGTTWFVWHNTTDENGYATFTFRLENCPQGEYTAYATAYLYLFGNAFATTRFTVNIPETQPPSNGTLIVKTAPISARVLVDGVLWGVSPQSRKLKPGMYVVSHEEVEGFNTPNNATVTVYESQTTVVEGIYQPMPGTTLIANPSLINNTYPFTINLTDAGVCLKIYSISDPVVIIIRKLTEPVDHAIPEGWTMLGTYVQIAVNNTNVSVNATLYIRYNEADLRETQLQEDALQIHFWNITTNGCCRVETIIDKNKQYAWANIDHFSTWAVMGQPMPSNPTRTWWVWVAVVALFGFLALGLIYDRKRRAVVLIGGRK